MRKLTSVAAIAVVLIAYGCTDKARDGATPTGSRSNSLNGSGTTMGTCTTLSNLTALASQVFGSGSPNVQSVIGKLNNMDKFVQQGDIVDAQAQAKNIVGFVQQKAAQGTLPGTPAQINAFLGGVLCYAGLSPDTFLIQPTDQAQVLTSSKGNSGVSLQGNTVTVPTLLTINTLDPNGPSGLITKLDQYPTFIDITTSSTITKPAVVAICLGASVPADVFARLRLGHQASTGFEITPPADPSFLSCPSSLTSTSKVPQWLRTLASLVLPKVAYARVRAFSTGGIGGSVTEFSPFDAVDPVLFATGGIGGSVTEFQRTPATRPNIPNAGAAGTGPMQPSKSLAPGSRSNTVINGVCTAVDATVGTALDPLCRPVLTLTTAKGTIMQNVPVSWAVTSGGGTIAPDTISDQACGTYGASASTSTDVNGKAGICWTLGITGGTNTSTATPSAGGDAPAGVTFSPPSTTFTASGNKITPVATATGASVTYDGLPHAGSGTCDNSLTPALSYSTSDGSVPVNSGTWTLTVTCGAGSNTYNTVTATATISISPVTPTVAVTCPVSVVYSGSAQSPCSATITSIGLNQTGTPTYSANTNVGTATASYTFAATGNYATATGSATFAITPAATTTIVTCAVTSTVYNGSAQTPCSATVTGPGGLNSTFTPAYSANTNVGTATASYTYAAGGNYLGSSGSKTFAITAATPMVSVTCSSAVYSGAAQTPCSATVTGPGGLSISVVPSYSNNVNAGTATASYTYSGGGNYTGAFGSATFQIMPAATTASVSCPVSVPYTGLPQTPCAGAVKGPGLSLTPTPTYSSNIVGTATATVNYLGGGNYLPSTASTTFKILYVQSGCFASPLYSSLPPTKSYQKAGSNLPVKCALLTSTGTAVTNATGNLLVQDKGLLGADPPITVFNQSNVFKLDQNKNYNYGLDTSLPGFISGHYYFVTAFWSDGSTTTGWFYLK